MVVHWKGRDLGSLLKICLKSNIGYPCDKNIAKSFKCTAEKRLVYRNRLKIQCFDFAGCVWALGNKNNSPLDQSAITSREPLQIRATRCWGLGGQRFGPHRPTHTHTHTYTHTPCKTQSHITAYKKPKFFNPQTMNLRTSLTQLK